MFPLTRREARPERGLTRRRVNPFGLLRDEFEPLVERLLSHWTIPEDWFRDMPSWEATEAEKEVVYRMPLPGFEVSEIELSMVGDELTLRAEHKAPEGKAPEAKATKGKTHEGKAAEGKGAEGKSAHPAGRFEESVEATVTLPAGLEPDKMAADFHNGLLEVHVPRSAAAVPRRIEVKTGNST